MAELQPADYVLGGITLVMAVTGLFRGFSGTLGFVLAGVAAALVGCLGWPYSASLTAVGWQRAAVTLVAALLAFGLVRLLVKKLVNVLLSQPTDALLGMLVGFGLGVLLLVVWVRSGLFLDCSFLARMCSAYVR
ncbi:MAG: hypothetical protein ACI4RD_07000 [Kiritimatiellia bacterium]